MGRKLLPRHDTRRGPDVLIDVEVVVGAEEPEPVLEEVAAERGAQLVPGVRRIVDGDGHVARLRVGGRLDVDVRRLRAGGVEIPEYVAVELVPPCFVMTFTTPPVFRPYSAW